MMIHLTVWLLSLLSASVSGQSTSTGTSAAGTARWIAQEALWGSVTFVHNDTHLTPNTSTPSPSSFVSVLPFASSTQHQGRIFLYLMGGEHEDASAAWLTLSQASLNPDLFGVGGCGTLENAVDAQDPRCVKASFKGKVQPCSQTANPQECQEIGQTALFSKHPSMQHWPENHHFHVCEFIVDSIWLIYHFGGASHVSGQDYASVLTAEPHKIHEGSSSPSSVSANVNIPPWNDFAARARWIVYHSKWTTVSTNTFTMIRSTVDGSDDCWSSTGRPYFYLPHADPLHIAMEQEQNHSVVLSFTQASLMWQGNQTCLHDVGSPTCGQVILYASAVPLLSPDNDSDERNDGWRARHVYDSFAAWHPLAPWLAQGGSHMAGTYYTLQIHRVMLLDYFGGYRQVPLDDYLQYMPTPEYFACSSTTFTSSTAKGPLFLSLVGFSIVGAVAFVIMGVAFILQNLRLKRIVVAPSSLVKKQQPHYESVQLV